MSGKEIAKQMLFFVLKVLLVLILIVAAFVVGTMIGYGVLGGGDPKAVFKPELWKHVFDYFLVR